MKKSKPVGETAGCIEVALTTIAQAILPARMVLNFNTISGLVGEGLEVLGVSA